MKRAEFAIMVALFASLFSCRDQQPAPPQSAASHEAHEHAPPQIAHAPVQKWQCPMHPQIISDRPGECPICNMKLVPITAPAEISPPPETPSGYAPIVISAERQRQLGVKSVEARIAPLETALRTTGRVTYDETRLHHVHTRYEAYVEQVFADFTGKFVKKGEPLAAVYSPELLAAENEYLLAHQSQKLGQKFGGLDLVAAARQKLRLWNISDADIAALEQRGRPSETLKLYSPIAGYVISKMAVHGMRVRPEDSLFDIVDLSRVWVLADVYEYELPRLRIGQSATMTLDYWPNRSWSGRVTYIYPAVDAKTRTIKVRLEVDNRENDLKAEMYASVRITAAPRSALLLPEEAVLETGTRQLVFVLEAGGKLMPHAVTIGERASGQLEIKSGVKAGEQVALGAAFLVDSESRLQAVLSGMTAPEARNPDGGGAP